MNDGISYDAILAFGYALMNIQQSETIDIEYEDVTNQVEEIKLLENENTK